MYKAQFVRCVVSMNPHQWNTVEDFYIGLIVILWYIGTVAGGYAACKVLICYRNRKKLLVVRLNLILKQQI